MNDQSRLVCFQTALGWFGVQFKQLQIQRVAIGYASMHDLRQRDEFKSISVARAIPPELSLLERFQAYCSGEPVDFNDLTLDNSGFSAFQHRVSMACRNIPYGTSCTYGQLADAAGSPRAFRAVGSVMSNNPFPIIVPCHRVTAASGKLGGFTSPQGTTLKKQLLQLEGNVNWQDRQLNFSCIS